MDLFDFGEFRAKSDIMTTTNRRQPTYSGIHLIFYRSIRFLQGYPLAQIVACLMLRLFQCLKCFNVAQNWRKVCQVVKKLATGWVYELLGDSFGSKLFGLWHIGCAWQV